MILLQKRQCFIDFFKFFRWIFRIFRAAHLNFPSFFAGARAWPGACEEGWKMCFFLSTGFSSRMVPKKTSGRRARTTALAGERRLRGSPQAIGEAALAADLFTALLEEPLLEHRYRLVNIFSSFFLNIWPLAGPNIAKKGGP